jgi:predicted acylesterase/phospholipase RssA
MPGYNLGYGRAVSLPGESTLMHRLLALVLCLLALAAPLCAEPQAGTVRVGLLFFQDEQDPLGKLREASEVFSLTTPAIRPSFAIGTYGELANWLDQELVDVAIINPGLFARLPASQWEYLGSKSLADESEGRSVWVSRKDSQLRTLGDLRKAGAALQVLAVHPLSVSGFLNPVSTLQTEGLPLEASMFRFSHSHTGSLSYIESESAPQIACVWEPTWRQHPHPSLQVVEIPASKIPNPPMAIVGKRGTSASRAIRELVQRGAFPHFEYDPSYPEAVALVPTAPIEGAHDRAMLDRVGLDDLVLTLRHYNQTHQDPARVGLVLTGGGAKCSYQAGAVRAIEERLAAARHDYEDPNLDIHVVVGTSGGAINALAVAMGLTETETGFADLRQAWLNLDQREIVAPPFLVRLNMWFWFASVAGLAILFLTRVSRRARKRGLALTLMIGLGLAALPRLPLSISRQLGDRSDLQHLWTWLSFGFEGAGVVLIMSAVAWGLMARRQKRRRKAFRARVPVGRILTFLVCILPVLQVWTVFLHEEVISENHGLESALTRNFSALIKAESTRRSQDQNSDVSSLSISELSEEVFTRKLLRRDLVLTASPLTDPELELPAEYYFYASPHGAVQPEFGVRGVPLAQRPELLFDAMLGSAAIYPLFPARRVQDLPVKGQHVDLVDGSFAHRSPLEAAVTWGATHLLVIEASTQEVVPRGKFLHNMGAAITFLYDQAQLVDVRSRSRVALYTLYPSAPHIGLLDFSEPLIEASLAKGYREASGVPTSSQGYQGGALHKALGPPRFWTP